LKIWGIFDSGQIFVNVCRITVFSIQEYSSFTGVICAESVASADVSSRARLNHICLCLKYNGLHFTD